MTTNVFRTEKRTRQFLTSSRHHLGQRQMAIRTGLSRKCHSLLKVHRRAFRPPRPSHVIDARRGTDAKTQQTRVLQKLSRLPRPRDQPRNTVVAVCEPPGRQQKSGPTSRCRGLSGRISPGLPAAAHPTRSRWRKPVSATVV